MNFTYKGLTAQLTKHTVTEAEVDAQIQRLRQSNPRIAPVKDRPTQLGDEVVLDYAGFCDGEQFAGGTAQKQTLTLGSGTFIPGFEEQLVDKVPGEAVTVNVTFPEKYHSEALAGKDAQFQCVIHEIRVKSQYELDDVFAQEVGGCYTFQEMREQLGKSMQAYTDERGEMDLQDTLLRQAAATLEVSFSDEEIKDALDQQVRNLEAQLSRQGLDLSMYCSFTGTTEEELRKDLLPTAEKALQMKACVEKIVALENLEATQEEIGQAVAVIARQNGMTVEQLKPHYDAAFEKAVISSILTSKVMRLIRDAADVTVVE